MDPSKFAADSPGRLVPCEAMGESRKAFVPNPLPPNTEISTNIWRLLGDAKEQIGILEGVGRNLPNPDILLAPLTKTEAIKSSSIEGTYATPLELLMYELKPTENDKNASTNDWRQVLNYSDALSYGISSYKERGRFTLNLIREMHQILLRGVRGKDRHPGQWRPGQVVIGWPANFIPPPRHEIEPLLENFIDYLNAESNDDYLLQAFISHYQFETIHPFSDGNGRIGRLLLSLSVQAWSPMTKPWLFLSQYFEANKSDYMSLLFDVSAKNAWSEWLEYCLTGTIVTVKRTINKVETLRKLQQKLHDMIRSVGGSVRLAAIVDQLFVSPFIDSPQARKLLSVSSPTVRSDLQKLEEAGILKKSPGNRRPIVYYSPEIFNVGYED